MKVMHRLSCKQTACFVVIVSVFVALVWNRQRVTKIVKCMSDDDVQSDDSDDALWEDDDDEGNDESMLTGPVRCLFCDTVLQSSSAVFDHCRNDHQFDVHQAARTWKLDSIGYIKMINYIRTQKPSPSSLKKTSVPLPWENDLFMKPSDPEDLLLQYDIESQGITDDGGGQGEITPEQRAAGAEARAALAEEELRRALTDLETVRSVMQKLMSSDPEVPENKTSVQNTTNPGDQGYFDSYSFYGVHHEMLKDKIRTESYRDMILKNKDLFAGKVVLDVGCGTGILSMFAAQAGASHVIGVDQSEIIYKAMDIIRGNKLQDKITLLKGKLEDMELPVKKVDIIISEWMGYFLLYESMLDTVLYARDTYLKEDGTVLPDRCTMSLVGSGDLDLYSDRLSFWDDVYGYNMSCIKSDVLPDAKIETVNSNLLVTEPVQFKNLDVSTCHQDDLQFTTTFSMKVVKDGSLVAFVGYFDTFFEKGCDTKVSFSTSPFTPVTHWSQTVFYLKKPRKVKEGEILEMKLTIKKNRRDPRSIIIHIHLDGVKNIYFLQ